MNRSRVFRKTAVTLVALLVFGLVRMPVESRLTERFVEAGLIDELPLTELRELAGQSVAFAVLGGLRPMLAIYLTLHAFDAWSYRKWETVEKDYRMITTLLPEDIDSWKTGAWHKIYNASASALYDDPSAPEAVRQRDAREWIDKGIAFLEKGIEHNPKSAVLHHDLARVYHDKLDRPCLAAEHYRLSMEGDYPKSYARRFYGYFLARCPGREREAYDYLMTLYHQGESQRLPTLIQRIKELEEKLAIPEANRIPEKDPDEEMRKRYPHYDQVAP